MITRIYKVVIFLLFATLLFTACNAARGSGNLVTELRDVSDYHSVSLSGAGDLVITQNGQESLVIETDENIMQYITSEVRDGTLHLGVREATVIDPSRLIFMVGVDDLAAVDLSGSGDIEADGIKTDRLDLSVSGSGNIQLGNLAAIDLEAQIDGRGSMEVAGEIMGQEIDLNGSGEYEGGNLRSETAVVTVSSSGDATIWATESLDAQVSGSGFVNYYGNPKVSSSASGSGDINSRGDK